MADTATASEAADGDAPGRVPVESAVVQTEERVELNSATAEELCTLPGIGPKKAAAIIEHRSRAPFTRITQLLRVKGIGARTLQRLRGLVYVKPRAEVAPSPSVAPAPLTAGSG